jgi:hypothetical protein
MSNVLSEAKRQQVIALGRLGRPLRRIEQETGVRRETASAYLKAAGVGVRPPRGWGRRGPAKPANKVTTGLDVELEAENAKRSVCEPFREAIELGLSRGRDASAIWQDLVVENGFGGGYQTVKRYVRKLRGNQPPQPRDQEKNPKWTTAPAPWCVIHRQENIDVPGRS